MVKADLDERLLQINPTQERESQLYIYSSELAGMLRDFRPQLNTWDWRQEIEKYLFEKNIKIWVADNIASLTPGMSENEKAEWDEVNQFLLRLRFKGITTILIHHLGKLGTQRGTSAREDNIDISISLEQPAGYIETDGCKFDLKFTKARLRVKELQGIFDLQLQLREDDKGNSTWTYTSIRKTNRNEILKLLDEEWTQKEITDHLNIDKGYVSRIKKEGIKNKLITPKGKLTQAGFIEIQKS